MLGVASSIGLGTGLHTFVLYLGPHIAKVSLAANECSYFPEMHPSRWEFRDFLPCKAPAAYEHQSVSFWSILLNVQLESFLWGLGTALGELPPYFMAKASAQAGKTNEEIEELRTLESIHPSTFMDKAKSFLYSHLKRHGFITVFLCASVITVLNQIPNPLFDLAGITCGHFGIPFSTFFGATFIGKAIIKVSLQAVFVIFIFSKHHVEAVLDVLEKNIPFLKNSLSKNLQKQKETLWHHRRNEESGESVKLYSSFQAKPLVASLWEVFITCMIVYFLISIINSVVNDRRVKLFLYRNENLMRNRKN